MRTAELSRALKEHHQNMWGEGHHRYIEPPIAHALSVPGKLVRPRMLVGSYYALGGTNESIYEIAYAAEIAHVGTLVHDDIIDCDATRRGIQSVNAKFGQSTALLAGDAFFFRLFSTLIDAEIDVREHEMLTVIGLFAELGLKLCGGQMLEQLKSGWPGIDMQVVEEISFLKTAAFFQTVCETGAVLAGANRQDTRVLADFGRAIGMAFQAADDLLPYTRDEDSTGKPSDSDLRNGRPTFPVALTYSRSSPGVQSDIAAPLSGSTEVPVSQRSARLAEIVESEGGISGIRTYVTAQCRSARRHLESVGITDGDLHDIVGIVENSVA